MKLSAKARAAAWLTIVLMVGVGIRYCFLIFTDPSTKPALATWLIFGTATAISIVSYLTSDNRNDLLTNAGNTVDVVVTWSILLVIIFFGYQVRKNFTTFEVGLLASCGLIVAYWLVRREPKTANIVTQVLLTVAYIPTIIGLWVAETSPEPLSVWITVLIASLFALVPPLEKKNLLAGIYAGRAVLMVSMIVALLVRLELQI